MTENSTILVIHKDVIFELIDGEIIILNLSNGNYYSVDGLGVIIWNLILQKFDAEQIVKIVFRLYKGEFDSKTIRKAIIEFSNDLLKEKLFDKVVKSSFPVCDDGISINTDYPIVTIPQFIKPVLHSYREIQQKYKHPAGIKRSDEL